MKKVSSWGLGTLHFGSLVDKQSAKNIIHKALDEGIHFFDTGPLYGSGEAETILGQALSHAPSDVTVCTKVGLTKSVRRDGSFGVDVVPLTEKNIRTTVEESLQRLKRPTIELLMLHAFDKTTPLRETFNVLQRLYQEGKIRAFGCSNFNPLQLKALLKVTQESQFPPFIAAQCHFNMIERRASRSFIDLCTRNNLSVVVNRVLARGALSGQYIQHQQFPLNSRAASSPRIQKWLSEGKVELLNALRAIAQKHALSLTAISLAWLFGQKGRFVGLIGVRGLQQLEECLNIRKIPLQEEVFHEIEVVMKDYPLIYNLPTRYLER